MVFNFFGEVPGLLPVAVCRRHRLACFSSWTCRATSSTPRLKHLQPDLVQPGNLNWTEHSLCNIYIYIFLFIIVKSSNIISCICISHSPPEIIFFLAEENITNPLKNMRKVAGSVSLKVLLTQKSQQLSWGDLKIWVCLKIWSPKFPWLSLIYPNKKGHLNWASKNRFTPLTKLEHAGLMTPCRTEKVDFSKKLKKQK